MCKEKQWRYRCGCKTTTIQPCRDQCFNDIHPESSLRSMPRDPGRPPCAFASPSSMDDPTGWLRPTECLSPTAYMVNARVCSRGSFDWKDVMGSYKGDPASLELDLESDELDANSTTKPVNLTARLNRWRQILTARRK